MRLAAERRRWIKGLFGCEKSTASQRDCIKMGRHIVSMGQRTAKIEAFS
jgi:hypothetical protein